MVIPENIKAKFEFLTKLTRAQKLSLLTFLFVLFVLPLSLIAALNPVIFNQRAQTVMTLPGGCPENIMCAVGFSGCIGSDGCPSCCPATTPTLAPPSAQLSTRVFVTSTTYSGNLGGLVGADAKCQERANTANLGGTWKAWLSDSTNSAASRLNQNTGSYQLLNGTVIANDWSDLTDGSLQNIFVVTELGTNFSARVWTNTKTDGSTKYQTDNATCANWTSNSGSYWAVTGTSYVPDSRWTDNNDTSFCSGSSNHLYCFEQPGTPPWIPTPTSTQSLGLIINPEIVKVQGVGDQFVKMFDMTATINSNYSISAIMLGNPNAIVTISPTGGYLGGGFTQVVSIKVPSGYVNTKYNYEVTVKANSVSKKIPVEVTIIAPTPIPTATLTPTSVPTSTPTPIKAPVPTFMPTPFPTPVPVMNQNPFIQTTSLPVAKWLNDYKASVIGYDKDMNDTLTMQITGLPFGLSQAPCNSSKLVDRAQIACAISGRPFGAGTYRVSVTIKDNKGGTTSSVLNLTVSSPFPRLVLPWTLRR
jgi:hypothetical protein